jgi:hypothetical protein
MAVSRGMMAATRVKCKMCHNDQLKGWGSVKCPHFTDHNVGMMQLNKDLCWSCVSPQSKEEICGAQIHA